MRSIATTLILILLAIHASGQEWTRFRGPNGTGIAAKGIYPTKISPETTAWKTTLPGKGHSSPVLWGNNLFLTSADTLVEKRHLLCLDSRNGKIKWDKSAPFKPYTTHEFNTAASSTPTVDAERVYVLWATPDNFIAEAWTHEGVKVWSRSFGAYKTQHGIAGSPILVDGMLLFSMEQEMKSGELIALDARTGVDKWRKTRSGQDAAPYSTPLILNGLAGKGIVYTSTTFGATCINPQNGETIWETGPLFKLRTVGSIIESAGLLIFGCGSGGGGNHAFAIAPPAKAGDKPRIVYKVPRGTAYVPTYITLGSRWLSIGDGGIVSCYDNATGTELWSERLEGPFFGSPILAGNRVFVVNARGALTVFEAGNKMVVVGRGNLEEECHSTPTAANGMIFLRSISTIVGLKEKL